MSIASELPHTDLSTRARLRNSAIEVFAARGFHATMREIAAHAGVTAGLITHHFGSKTNLRAECDTEVLRLYRTIKGDSIAMSPAQSMVMLAEVDKNVPALVYILRSVRDGGRAGVEFLENMVQEAAAFSVDGVAAGIVRESRDPLARARYLVTTGLGGIMLQLPLGSHLDLADVGPAIRRIVDDITLPSLELYTEGVLTDHRYLDEYLRYLAESANGAPSTSQLDTADSESTP
jgi:AcrR family transcriptional regulator